VISGTTWIYDYNDYNLQVTIETKWLGVKTAEPYYYA
jgi:hypothetical protein